MPIREFVIEDSDKLVDEVLEDHVTQVDLDLSFFVLVVQPVVLLLDCFS